MPCNSHDAVTFVVPAGLADPAWPSGGNTYDLRICAAMRAAGRQVRMRPVDGAWPRPDAAARERLDQVLGAVPDGAVVVCDGLVACGVPEVVAPHAARLRLAVLVHLPLADETGLPAAVADELAARERATLTAASVVLVTSGWAARRVAQAHDLAAERVRVVSPGVEEAPLGEDGDGSRLLCVASVTPRKGHDLLVEALAAVWDLPWECRCVGPSPDEAYLARLQRLVRASDLAGRVGFGGPLTAAQLTAAYAAADLVVLSSRAETYGMVVTEALAHGRPVLATAVGGVPEAVGGEGPGLLVAPTAAAIADGLRRWLTEAQLRRTLREAARRRRVTLTGWPEAARELTCVLDGLR